MSLLVYMVDTLPMGLSNRALYLIYRDVPLELYVEAGLVLLPLTASRN